MLSGLRNVEAENCEAEFVFSVDVFRCDESLFPPDSSTIYWELKHISCPLYNLPAKKSMFIFYIVF